MKAVEIGFRSKAAELEKLTARLERAQNTLTKKRATAEKFGVADWDCDQYREWLNGVETTANGWIISKADIKKNGAWSDLFGAQREVNELTEQIERAEKRLQIAEQKVEEYRREVEAMADLKAKEELRKLEFEQEQKEWARDGITLERRYAGITPNGKRFYIDRNSGATTRSWHCFSLIVDGEMVFTSGEFWRAYSVVKRS
jgi:chromosome segregation ATPase